MSRDNYKSALFDLLNKQKYCDVNFTLKDDDGKLVTIGAHKLILSVASEVFETMFFGTTVQNGGVTQENDINISDIRMHTFKLFLG